MIIDCHGHYTTAPKALIAWRDAQIAALLPLLAGIAQRYRIPPANYLGHGDIAPRRKVDPSRYFPWRTLAANGYGLWCDPPWSEPPQDFDALLGLKALGYDLSDVAAAIAAFKRHFAPADALRELTAENRSMLYCLLNKRAGATR